MKKLYFILIIALGSCKKFVEIPPPEGQILSSTVFTSDVKANSAVTAIYGNMINGSPAFCNFLTSLYAGMSSDELSRYNPSVVFQEFMNNALTASNAQVRNLWSSAYRTIYNCNVVLEGLASSTQVSSTMNEQLSAECKVVRALSYFYLVNLFGDVPLVSSTDFSINAKVSRSSIASVYHFIIDDLQAARSTLAKVYPGNEKVRPNYWAATALLARACLYTGDWKNAVLYSGEVINSNLFTPLQNPQGAFLKNSKEAIWQLSPISGLLQETRQMRPSGSTPQVFIRPSLLNAFEPGDLRRTRWMDSMNFQSTKYYYPGKYKNTGSAVTEYYMVLRIGEQFLIRAEARAQLDSIPAAMDDINAIRTRANLPALSNSLSKEQALAAVEQERKVELFAEWAHRWLDLKRNGRADVILAQLKNGWQPTDQLFPIPQDDLLTNISLQQNPGY